MPNNFPRIKNKLGIMKNINPIISNVIKTIIPASFNNTGIFILFI